MNRVTDPAAPEGFTALRLMSLLFSLRPDIREPNLKALATAVSPDWRQDDDDPTMVDDVREKWNDGRGAEVTVIHNGGVTDLEVVAPTFAVAIAQHNYGEDYGEIVLFSDAEERNLAVSARFSGSANDFRDWVASLALYVKMFA